MTTERIRAVGDEELTAAVARVTRPSGPVRELFAEPERPLEIDIGTGNGDYLLGRCTERVNLVGIEWGAKFAYRAQRRMLKRDIDNVLVVHGEAVRYLETWIESASVQRYTVMFPDPWWKKRHRRRRVFSPRLAESMARTLVPGGTVLLASDQEEYVEASVGVVLGCDGLRLLRQGRSGVPPRTKFERQFVEQGLPIFELEAERVG